MDDLRYWVGFSRVPGIGPVKANRLLDHFGQLSLAWVATSEDLLAAGLDPKAVESILAVRARLDLDREMERLERQGIAAISLNSPDYPERLRAIYSPPLVLYIKGDLRPEDEWSIGVVGTRRATVYGREITERIVGDLAAGGVTIVSGLAKGIDSHAHRACLDAGGRTIAVLGCGVDLVYPPENLQLARAIVEQGALVSEYAPGTQPEATNFPARNRIIAGLSMGTLVIEAGERSGALITATFALEQGRDVFAIPGNVLSRASIGCNRLIQQGAKLVIEAEDILQELNLRQVPQQMAMRELLPSDEKESKLLALLREEPVHIDELVRGSDLAAADVTATLTMMELKGLVRYLGGNIYAARP